jgi:hypothetical protein
VHLLLQNQYHFFLTGPMATSFFTDRWKVAYVTRIFKKGRRNNVENYRGVAILSDRVRYQLLLNEMFVGIDTARCMWLGSYLSRRIQKIRIGDAVFKDIKVTLGVPQEWTTLLHLVCQQDISEIFNYVRVLFYADDMKLFLPVSGFQDCLRIQLDLNKLSE